ncbi:SCO family protein [Chitinophaga silvatica]|uniref:SCO family protein n=1 Tax=Chitinophaga silvatica TaxID=2282649 RepID=A0A3E1YH92_9BACT|nr:SCO family protein [Chitinophaga silvatica]RFS26590.1 SCO family protein [Chitinophaga silvatica]
MKRLYLQITHSWKIALTGLLILPLVAYGIVHWIEKKYASLPYYGPNNVITDQANAVRLPNFTFQDQYNEVINNQSIQNKIVLANFFFTSCPTVCPKMLAQLKRVIDICNQPTLIILSLTVDPQHDSISVLQRYSKKHNLPTTWKLLTGNKKSLYYFARKGLFITATDGDGGPTDFIHSNYIVLLDQQQKIRGYYLGTSENEMNDLIADIKNLQHEQ